MTNTATQNIHSPAARHSVQDRIRAGEFEFKVPYPSLDRNDFPSLEVYKAAMKTEDYRKAREAHTKDQRDGFYVRFRAALEEEHGTVLLSKDTRDRLFTMMKDSSDGESFYVKSDMYEELANLVHDALRDNSPSV